MEQQYRSVIGKSIGIILDRFERNASGFGFIDTKFNIVTGRDFDGAEPYFRNDFIFGWIQGRALESLAKHYEYYHARNEAELCRRLKDALRKLAARLEECRARHGHIWFAMTPDGAPRGAVTPEHSSFADLFYGKGLCCASAVLDDPALMAVGEEILDTVFADIDAERFVSGQQSFDPKNPASRTSPDKVPEGPRMISLGALSDLVRLSSRRAEYARTAARFITFILDNHAFRRSGKLCFCEDIHRTERTPYVDAGHILCDPGHCLELTGLAGRCLRMMRENGLEDAALLERCAVLPELFARMFALGFRPGPGGIVKSADAVTDELLNTDMPWWSLPETMRAAHELAGLFPQSRPALEKAAAAARDAFAKYLQPNGFACQTRDERGEIVSVIPAVPDADPGYHTNLSLMDS
ncbi:MAG: hypothetical protein IJS14_02700 [Lentisphaeria bacterium]|nr:hypothetical protein [Lentisphaeria bacterium]